MAAPDESPAALAPPAPRLEILKALGDNTRYAIYLELARASMPLATAQIAEGLDLHPNTVRPHLERMREVGLLEVVTDARGAVGRPHHRYSLAPDAPALGFEPPAFPVLAHMLLRLASSAGLPAADAVEAGREQGEAAALRQPGVSCEDALINELASLGFDPAAVADDHGVTVGFTRCPFRELAEANPELVCGLHRGLVEGIVDTRGGGSVAEFHDLAHRRPCQVEIALAPR
ncbi:MAG: helix-turn-helix domain-containing protein [Acidimicrobiales bacterium]|nr:helix-turn-helix domain-containing protein [Acidimicrobiales bacterium]